MNEPQTEQIQEKIDVVKIEDEMRSSYLDYSMSVIIGRALPDARDGLKPVHRRVLYAMYELGNTHNRPYKKSARVVGDVIGKYHPHGEAAVYDALVRMAQDFSLRYPLIDGQGNFGSIDGDPPAAMRYTEVRMNRLAEEMLADIDKETVDFVPNYDGSLQQPAVLPSKIPNIIINGATGIAVGMATNIPPHNISEVVDALIFLIDNPDCKVEDLMKYIIGPDFPTGGSICGIYQIKKMYLEGRGQLTVKGRASIEEGKHGKNIIIITEIPYGVNKSNLIDNIAELVQNKIIDGVSDIRDESNKEGIRIVIELKREAIPNVVLNNIYKHTQLQITYGAILLAIDHGRPRVMNLKDLLKCFLDHRFEVITRRTKFELNKAEARAHILEGLKTALNNLDTVVKIIKNAKNREEAKNELMSKLKLTDIQANSILDMRLYQLTSLERSKIEEEYLELIKKIAYLKNLLSNVSNRYSLIKQELLEIKQTYGDYRRTEIIAENGDMHIEDLIADRGWVITVTHSGYIKRMPVETYRLQHRGGKGVTGIIPKEEDFVQHVFTATTHDYIMFFTNNGRAYWLKVYEIPEGTRISKGKAIVNLLNIKQEERITTMCSVREFPKDKYLVMATKYGVVKKTNLSAFKNPRKDGIIAINIDKGDELIDVRLTDGKSEIMLSTRNGFNIRFPETQLRDQGRATRGVRGILLKKDDHIVGLDIVDPEGTYFVCTENGYGKRTEFTEYRTQNRGGKGITTIKITEKNGKVIATHAVREKDALVLITARGKMIRFNVSSVPVIGRVTQGVKLIDLDENDKLVAATISPED